MINIFEKQQRSTSLFLAIAFFFTFGFILQSCEDEAAITPKPRGFPKVVYPEKSYKSFEEGYCNFSFQYPTYAKVEKTNSFFDERPSNECWFDISIPSFNAKIHCTYSPIDSKETGEKLRTDAFELAHKHNIKAKYIEEIKIDTKNGAKGFAFNLEGEVASPFQFYVTDEEKHFVRGSLYFNNEVAPDSLAPIFSFVKKDIEYMINTLKWQN
ncbi:MAG: hypothetical protein AB8F94_10670 [Saprospiraceae bacterium]